MCGDAGDLGLVQAVHSWSRRRRRGDPRLLPTIYTYLEKRRWQSLACPGHSVVASVEALAVYAFYLAAQSWPYGGANGLGFVPIAQSFQTCNRGTASREVPHFPSIPLFYFFIYLLTSGENAWVL